MPLENSLVMVGQSRLLAGGLFTVRWWAETYGADLTHRDRRTARVLVGLAGAAILLGMLIELASAR